MATSLTFSKGPPLLYSASQANRLRNYGKRADGDPSPLLSYVGKVLEDVMAAKMTEAAEFCDILPPEQFGNKAGRSTELAARVVIETAKAAWASKLTTSLLQLDLKGAF